MLSPWLLPGWIQGHTRHSGWLPHCKQLVWAESLSNMRILLIYMLTVPPADHPAHHSLKKPGVQRAASIPCWGGKNLSDQISPSRAVNQSPRNASFHKSCSCSTSQVPKHHPTSQSSEKNLPNEDPPAQSWFQGLTPKQHNKSQPPLHTSLHVTHLEGIKCILLGEERSSVCSGEALPAGGCSKISGCTPEGE